MYEHFAHMYICVPHEFLVPTEVRKDSDFLELELQMIVSRHVVARNETLIHCRKKCFQSLSHLCSPLKNVHTICF